MTVYGGFHGDANEATPLRSDLGAYGAAQIAAEQLAARYRDTVILRPGCEYGPGCWQWSERIARLLRSHRLGDLGSAGDGYCNLLYIDDLVGAIVAALTLPAIGGRQFNLAMPAPPTWNEYFVRFGKALGAVPISRIGRRRLDIETKVLAPLLKVAQMATSRAERARRVVPPPVTPSLIKLCGQPISLNVQSAREILRIEWTALDEGLRRTAAAFRIS